MQGGLLGYLAGKPSAASKLRAIPRTETQRLETERLARQLTEAQAGEALSVTAPRAVPSDDRGVYKVELGADGELSIPGPPGELRVWIGIPSEKSHIPASMERAVDTLPAVGKTARITPFAPSFDVQPKESVCMRIIPKGSECRFSLTPKKAGTFKVGADVYLFDSADCSGTPIPQTARTMEVHVVVNTREQVREHTDQLWAVFWQKLLDFWGALLALGFGVVLFLVRKRLKKWFGFGE